MSLCKERKSYKTGKKTPKASDSGQVSMEIYFLYPTENWEEKEKKEQSM